MAPKLLARRVVADQAERGEITDDGAAIRGWGGGGGAAFGTVESLECVRLDAAGPKLPPVAAVVTTSLELAVGEGGEEDPVPPNAGRGGRPRHVDFPQDAVGRADSHGRFGIGGDPGTVRPAKLRPVRRGKFPPRKRQPRPSDQPRPRQPC